MTIAHRLALVGYWLLAVSLVAVVLLIFFVVDGRGAGIAAAAVTGILLLSLWGALPMAARRTQCPHLWDADGVDQRVM